MKRFPHRSVATAGILCLAACSADFDTQPSERAFGEARRYIVGFTHSAAAAGDAALQAANAKQVLAIRGMNAAAYLIPPEAAAALARDPSVAFIEEDVRRYPLADAVPYGIEMVQAPLVSDESAANRNVCVIDSGYYIDHVDLQDNNVTASPDLASGDPFIDPCGHGTHVTGTISALANGGGVLGVLPSGLVGLHIVKVFGNDDWESDSCGYSHSSEVINAAQDCADAGAHIINMSLGGANSSNAEAQAFQALFDQGVLLVAAAGNDGNTEYGFPASYDSVMSVAAIDQNKQHAAFSQRNDQVEIAAPGVSVLSTTPVENASLLIDGQHYRVGYMEGSVRTVAAAPLAEGGLCDALNSSWSGRVVLCERGEISFADKARNVASSGGLAAVVFNNEDGNFGGTVEDGGPVPQVPAVSLSREDGLALLANGLGDQATVSTELKVPGDGYETQPGTSMASPHVAGVAALIWSHDTSWTNQQIRDALVATAEGLGTEGRNDEFGHGLVQARAALDYLTGECTLGIDNVTSTSVAGETGRFTVSWDTDVPATSEVTFDCCGSYTDGEQKTSHRMTFHGSPGTSYEYVVGGTNPTGCSADTEPFTHAN